MTRVVLGNRNAVHSRDNGETIEHLKGKRATVIDLEDGPLVEQLRNITDERGIWATHAKAGTTPAWVASESPTLAAVLSEHWGGIEIRDLEDPYQGRFFGGGAAAASTTLTTLLTLPLAVLALAWLVLGRLSPMLKTNAGNDFQANQMAGTASATAVAKWVAITANATAPAATDTTLTGEITTAGGGLLRKVGTFAHTTGAASYTITTTFTANGSDSLPVTIAKRGHFDAASAGNLVFESLVLPTATLSGAGDAVTLTDTVSL